MASVPRELLTVALVTCAVVILSSLQSVRAAGVQCTSSSDCGWLAQCVADVCSCDSGLDLHTNGKDCKNSTCSDVGCLECDIQQVCTKCVSFVAKSTGVCLEKCEGSAEMQGDSLVCTESNDGGEDDDDDDEIIIIAVVGGVAAGAVLCIIVIIAVCIYIRRTRRNINLQSKNYTGRHMDTGNVKKFSVYDNNAFDHGPQEEDIQLESDLSGFDYRLSKKMDPLEYQTELERLRPHMDMLMLLLSQTRGKTRAMKEGDPRLPTYKGVIHQLCRVLVLLHKKDPVRNLPSDALSLVQWGHQMVEDARQQEGSASDTTVDFPIAQISTVDLDTDYPHPISPVYATPDGSTDQGFPLPAPGQATPYHSVPVPLTPAHVEETDPTSQQTLRRSGFASISRTPSIPNGVIVKNLEFSQPREETVQHVDPEVSQQNKTASLPHHQPQIDPSQVVRLRREEFRNFLITNKDSLSQQQRISSVDDIEGETVITGGEGGSLDRESLGQQNNLSSNEEESKFNTFGRKTKLVNTHMEDKDNTVLGSKKPSSLPRPLSTPNFGLVLEQYFHSGSSASPVGEKSEFHPTKRPVSQTYSIPHKQQQPRQQVLKKNIITNPNAIKGNSSYSPNLGAAGKKSKQVSAVPATTGYFANGHFYDPNPMPVDCVDGEVYAPGSNYSDHSNIMSTFLGDLPRSRSQSSSNQSEEGDESENSGGELDVFPFDPNEATDPVEV